ncbi:MAG: methyltransferase domain-containing protein [Cyanobacteria bacterium P01_F01_bin.150]
MKELDTELLKKIQEQYDNLPYPQIPIERTSKDDKTLDSLFVHNLVTSYYLRYQKVVDTNGKVILDAGCGSGYKSLLLAEANPGAKIVGIDLSEPSVDFARTRLAYHGFDNVEFHVMRLEDVSTLGIKFDYVNCDEVLYLVPDPLECLKALKSVLNEQGILRGNFHSKFQRQNYYRAQSLFKMMGLMDNTPGDLEIELAIEIMKALQDGVQLKQQVWTPDLERLDQKEAILVNLMLQGDRGFTIPQVFELLEATNLELISMVEWKRWELSALFKDPDNLHPFLAMSLPEISLKDGLHLFELLHPINRLIDFWCGHPNMPKPQQHPQEWTDPQWDNAQIYLHPQLHHSTVKEKLERAIRQRKFLDLHQFINIPASAPVTINHTDAACLLPLWEDRQTFVDLVSRRQAICPVDPLTLQPISDADARQHLKKLLIQLEIFLYILLETEEL